MKKALMLSVSVLAMSLAVLPAVGFATTYQANIGDSVTLSSTLKQDLDISLWPDYDSGDGHTIEYNGVYVLRDPSGEMLTSGATEQLPIITGEGPPGHVTYSASQTFTVDTVGTYTMCTTIVSFELDYNPSTGGYDMSNLKVLEEECHEVDVMYPAPERTGIIQLIIQFVLQYFGWLLP